MSRVLQNVIANLSGKVWTVLVSLAVVPVYIRVLGMEAYGLLGVFSALIAIFAVLDFGLGNSLNRQLAQYSVQPGREQDMHNLLRTLEIVYWGVGAVIGAVTAALAPLIASHWIQPGQMDVDSVAQTLALMGIAIAVQWPRALYTGGLMGIQRQVALNVLSSACATVLSVGGALIVSLVWPSIQAFVVWTIVIGLAEAILTRTLLLNSLPAAPGRVRFSRQQLLAVWRFAAGLTGISILAMVLGQLDKVILSKLLSLEAFGYYSLAWRVVSGLYLLISPVQSACFPRFSQLAALGESRELARAYHRGSQLMAVVLLPAAIIAGFFAEELLQLWTLDAAVVSNTATILAVLAAGTAINGLLNMPASLQLAYGRTRLVLLANVVAVSVLAPLIYVASVRFGGLGAAWIWLILNVGYVVFTLPLMHRDLLPGHLGRWLLVDVGAPLAAALAAAGIWKLVVGIPHSYAGMLASVAGASLLVLLAALAAAPEVRSAIAVLRADWRAGGPLKQPPPP